VRLTAHVEPTHKRRRILGSVDVSPVTARHGHPRQSTRAITCSWERLYPPLLSSGPHAVDPQTHLGLALKLPEFTTVSTEVLRAVASSHKLDADGPLVQLPETGIFNAVYLLGEHHVLRIPRNHPKHIEALYREAIAVPAARQAGVRTPALVVFDDTCDLVSVPYVIYERVHGETLAELDLEPLPAADVWRELGRDLARLHAVTAGDLAAPLSSQKALPDPRELVASRSSDGWFTSSEARWLLAWLDRLAPMALTPVPSRVLHGDSQATNVMVTPDPLRYVAVIDWGSAGWGDAAEGFAGVPLRAVPFMLQGHRYLTALDHDDSAEARILWRHLQLGLFALPRGTVPGRSWAERPLAMLFEILRFFLADPDERWADLAP
jgi:aminoglycoside phosphotransferase (APT) family kinase protein